MDNSNVSVTKAFRLTVNSKTIKSCSVDLPYIDAVMIDQCAFYVFSGSIFIEAKGLSEEVTVRLHGFHEDFVISVIYVLEIRTLES